MAFAPTTRSTAAKPSGRGTGRSATHLSAWLWIATMALSTVCSVALINHPVPVAQLSDSAGITAR